MIPFPHFMYKGELDGASGMPLETGRYCVATWAATAARGTKFAPAGETEAHRRSMSEKEASRSRGFLRHRANLQAKAARKSSRHYEWQEVGRYWPGMLLLTLAFVDTVATEPAGGVAVPHTHSTSLLALM